MAASTAVDQFKGDLSATIKFLGSMSSMPNYESIRQIQADALTKRAAGLCLDPEAGAALADSWSTGPWSVDQTKAFSEVLAKGVSATSGSKGSKNRRENQLCSSFESYLSEKDVEVLTSVSSIHIKLDTAASRCCRLRLTLPSEQCVKSILAAIAARSGGTCTEAELFLQVGEFKRVLRLKAKKVPKEGIHIETYPVGGPRELPDVLFKAAYDAEDGPVSTLLPAGQVALKAMDISLRPTNKKVRGIFATPKASTAMVPANSMSMPGMHMGGMNMMVNPYMQGMMGMHGMPHASSMQGLMQWMKQQQDLATQQGGLQNLQIFAPGTGSSSGSQQPPSSSTPACAQQLCSSTQAQQPSSSTQAQQPSSSTQAQQPENGESGIETKPADPFAFQLDTTQALEEATKVSDALDNRKTGGQGKRTADEFEGGCKLAGIQKLAMSLDVASLGRKHYVSQSGLAAVLKEVSESSSTVAPSRSGIKRAREEQVAIDTPYGALIDNMQIKDKKGKERSFPTLNLKAWMWYVVKNLLVSFFSRKFLEHPPKANTPWRVCLYCDEISPGNQLKQQNTRKIQAYYLSFHEFGAEFRCQEQMWFTVALARSHLVNQLPGGLSQFTHHLLQALKLEDFEHGLLLDSGGERVMFFAKLDTMVADEAALKAVFDVKGSSGTLPCPLCSNVVAKTSMLEGCDTTGTLVPVHETALEKFCARTDNTIWQGCRLLQSRCGQVSKKAFEQLEQSLGMNHNPDGVLFHGSLPLASTLMYDWLHCYLVAGLMHVELGLLFPILYTHGVTVESLKDWMCSFEWPYGLRTHRNETLRIFDKRIPPGEFKCSASQGLNLYPLLRLFLLSLATGSIPDLLAKAMTSCLNLFLVLDLLLKGNRGEQVPPDDLEAAILKHCRAFLSAYGSEHVVPKFHYSLHLGAFARKKPLISCFTHEKKHRQIKQLANEIHNPGDWFEKSVFKDVWGEVILQMQADSFSLQPHLLSPKKATISLQAMLNANFGDRACGATFSFQAVCRPGQSCEKGDLVLLSSGDVVQVWLHCRLYDGDMCTLCSILKPLGKNRFLLDDSTARFIPSVHIQRACYYKKCPKDGEVMVTPA
ncbi:unnamed protein product [Symbiodinium sp. CCMP2592]|nr:unnamed protein product [Symbiodinium sp. CCMP2592]